jgi:putative chitinase
MEGRDMTLVTPDLIRRIAPHLGPAGARGLAIRLTAALPHAGISTPRQVRHFLAQIGHESAGFTALEESLTYSSAARIRKTWPSRFPTLADAAPFVRSPKALAERVYGGRMGNDQPGDGWRFRGRGLKQLTGRDNYRRFTAWARARGFKVDFEAAPELVAQPPYADLSAAWFWAANGLNDILAAHTRDDTALLALTRRINGGLNGLPDRRARLAAVAAAQAELAVAA